MNETHSRRREDNLSNAEKILGIVKANIPTILAIGALFFWLGSTRWVTQSEAKACHNELKVEVDRVMVKTVEIDKTSAVAITGFTEQMKAVNQRLQSIEAKLK